MKQTEQIEVSYLIERKLTTLQRVIKFFFRKYNPNKKFITGLTIDDFQIKGIEGSELIDVNESSKGKYDISFKNPTLWDGMLIIES